MSNIITIIIQITLKRIFNIEDFEIKRVHGLSGFNISIIIYFPKFKYLFKRRKIKKYLKNNVIPAGIELIIKSKEI